MRKDKNLYLLLFVIVSITILQYSLISNALLSITLGILYSFFAIAMIQMNWLCKKEEKKGYETRQEQEKISKCTLYIAIAITANIAFTGLDIVVMKSRKVDAMQTEILIMACIGVAVLAWRKFFFKRLYIIRNMGNCISIKRIGSYHAVLLSKTTAWFDTSKDVIEIFQGQQRIGTFDLSIDLKEKLEAVGIPKK